MAVLLWTGPILTAPSRPWPVPSERRRIIQPHAAPAGQSMLHGLFPDALQRGMRQVTMPFPYMQQRCPPPLPDCLAPAFLRKRLDLPGFMECVHVLPPPVAGGLTLAPKAANARDTFVNEHGEILTLFSPFHTTLSHGPGR